MIIMRYFPWLDGVLTENELCLSVDFDRDERFLTKQYFAGIETMESPIGIIVKRSVRSMKMIT